METKIERKPVIQGDVMLYPINSLPAGEAKPGKRHTLALGEVTGHSHVLDRAVMVEVDGERYVEAEQGAALQHEDHGPVVVPLGAYRVIQQKEPDLLGGFRAVAD